MKQECDKTSYRNSSICLIKAIQCQLQRIYFSILGKSASALVMIVPAFKPPHASPSLETASLHPREASAFFDVAGKNADKMQ